MSLQKKSPLRKKVAKIIRTPALAAIFGAVGAVGTGGTMYHLGMDDWDNKDTVENTILVEAFEKRFDKMELIAQNLKKNKQGYVLSVVSKDGQKNKNKKAWQQETNQLVEESTELARALMFSEIDEKDAQSLANKFVDAGLNNYSDIDLPTSGFNAKNEAMASQGGRPDDQNIKKALVEMRKEEKLIFIAPLVGLMGGITSGMLGLLFSMSASSSRRIRRWSELPNMNKQKTAQLKRN